MYRVPLCCAGSGLFRSQGRYKRHQSGPGVMLYFTLYTKYYKMFTKRNIVNTLRYILHNIHFSITTSDLNQTGQAPLITNPPPINQSSHLGIHTQILVGIYLDPRQSSIASKSAEGLQKVGIMKPLFWLNVGSFNKSSPRS